MFGWPIIVLTGLSVFLLKGNSPFGPRKIAGMTSVFMVGYFGGVGLWITLVVNALYRIGMDLGFL